jgi:hypothetical protein
MTATGSSTAVFTARLLLSSGCEYKTGSPGRLFQHLSPGRSVDASRYLGGGLKVRLGRHPFPPRNATVNKPNTDPKKQKKNKNHFTPII